MKLSEKIYYYRKKTGRSQEGLAEQLGVSRQAVSKWETGESEPEIAKLKQLAITFGVTVDFLLSEEEPPEAVVQPKTEPQADRMQETVPPARQSSSFGGFGKLCRRWGWLSGVYVSLVGAGMMLIGALATFLSTRMVSAYEKSVDEMMGAFGGYSGIESIVGPSVIEGVYGGTITVMDPAVPQIEVFNPVGVVGGVILTVGAIVCIGGVILALWLKKKGKQ